MADPVVEELTSYVDFGPADQAALRSLLPAALPELERVAQRFYERIEAHTPTRQVLERGEHQVGHLRVTLVAWLDRLLRGPWDEEYWEGRLRIGRVHVRVGLPQHHMFGAMNVLREELARVAHRRFLAEPERLWPVRAALDKILDLELAVMLHTYRDDLLAQQARVERLSVFGQLVGSIGHELRNPLGVIASSLHILRTRAPADVRTHTHLDRISEQVDVATGIVSNLLDMIRDRPLASEPVRLGEVARGAVATVRTPPELTVSFEAMEELPAVDGDPRQLRQVFANLVENAVQAASPHGEVLLRGALTGAEVRVEVDDSGPGVDPATRRRLFEPLITTKEHGTGLGLALVRRIVERHGGRIEYSDRPGGGARFTIHLPVRLPAP